LVVSNSVKILGPGPANLAIGRATGSPTSRIIYVTSNHIVTISGLAITNGNVVGTFGGGIYNDHSMLTVSNCTISGNSAAHGGGIYSDGSGLGGSNATLNVIASTFNNNTAVEAGGGIFNEGDGSGHAALHVTGSTFNHNSAPAGEGGAIEDHYGSGFPEMTLMASTFSSNSATFFGGAVASSGLPPGPDDDIAAGKLIANCTFNGNTAPSGGSIHSMGAAIEIGSTILNAGGTNANLGTNFGGSFFSFGYNLTSDGGGGVFTNSTDITNTDPQLGPLQDNGGPTLTYAPLCGSPAIDKGRNFIFGTLEDQRGAPRIFDDPNVPNASGGDGTDIGAVESPIFAYVVSNTNDSGPGSLRQAVLDANAHAGMDAIEFVTNAYGTIKLTSGELLITDCLILDGPGATNVAVNGNAASRVFHVSNSIVAAISGLTITKGSADGAGYPDGFGGGILNDHSTLLLQNCNVRSNSAAQTGGIFNDGSSTKSAAMSIVNCTVSGNNSFGSGAGIRSDGSGGGSATLLVANSTISGNSTEVAGGGFYSLGQAALTLYNCTLSGNNGPHGSGIANLGTTLILGSTILNATGPDRFTNSIINNGSGSVVSLGYNLSSDDGSGFLNQPTDQTNTAPMLGPLQLNGGQTPTHALLCGSTAIDAGTNFSGSTTDQRGLARAVNDPGVANVADGTDIGAFEAQTPPACNNPPVAVCTNVTVSADSNCVANASIDNGSYDPDAGDSITNSVQTPVEPYSLGTNEVVLTVTDSHGASSSCTGLVFVVDTTPPTIHCPTNIVATNDSGQCSALVNYTVKADDNCSSVTLSEDFPSGSTFSKGTNTVTVIGVDVAGNTNTCIFTVTVLDNEAPLVMCRPAPNPSGKVSEPGKNGSGANPSGYYQVLTKDNCDAAPKIYIKDTKSPFVAGPFKDGDIVRLKRAGAAPSSVPGSAPVVATISLKGNGLAVAQDADGNRTPDASGCVMAVSQK